MIFANNSVFPSGYVYQRIFTTSDNKELAAYFIVWSPIDDPLRLGVRYDASFSLASINAATEQFFDNCLVDAVAYAGDKGPVIRDVIRQGISYAVVQPDGTSKLSYISESIGSKFLLDVVNSLSSRTNQALLDRLSRFDYFYMMANQIPILNQATAHAIGAPLAEIHSFFAKTRGSKTERPTIVNFADPNDILSYPLPASTTPDARVINVFVSNDYTYAGLIENPANAHCGYGTNQAVINIITNGDAHKGPPIPNNILGLACQ